jgi:hypothetical protein
MPVNNNIFKRIFKEKLHMRINKVFEEAYLKQVGHNIIAEETNEQMMREIYNGYVENQRRKDEANGFTIMRAISVERFVEKFKYRFQKFLTVPVEVFEVEVVKLLDKLCDPALGWEKTVKNGQRLYFNPKYVRNTEISWLTIIPEYFFDPNRMVWQLLDQIKNTNLLTPDFDSNDWNGNTIHSCTTSFKVKF